MLLNYFTPALYLKSYEDLDPAWLVRRKIRLLILDIDNTLAAHDEQVAQAHHEHVLGDGARIRAGDDHGEGVLAE